MRSVRTWAVESPLAMKWRIALRSIKGQTIGCLIAFAAGLPSPAQAIDIHFAATRIHDDIFRYDYEIRNDGSLGIGAALRSLDLLFDMASVDESTLALVGMPASGAAWTPTFLASAPGVPPAFDLYTTGPGLAPGDTLAGFAVQFRWTGIDTPAAQVYEIYDPQSFALLQTGLTVASPVPETSKTTQLLLGSILLLAATRRRIFRRSSDRSNARHASKRRRLMSIFAWTVGAFTTIHCRADPALSVINYELANQTRISQTMYQYVYRLVIRNTGSAAVNVSITLGQPGDGLTIVSGGADLDRVEAGATRTTSPTITLRHDRTRPFDVGRLHWTISAEDGDFTGTLPGATTDRALDRFTNFRDRNFSPMIDSTSSDVQIALQQLRLTLAGDVTVGQINALLTSTGSRIIGIRKGERDLLLLVPGGNSVAALDAIATQMRSMPGILSVSNERLAIPANLPNNQPFLNPFDLSSFVPASDYIAAALAIRSAAAWNVAGLLDIGDRPLRRPVLVYSDRFTSSGRIPGTRRLLDGFITVDADSVWDVQILQPADFLGPFLSIENLAKVPSPTHGYEVMSTAAAAVEPLERGGTVLAAPAHPSAQTVISGVFPRSLPIRVVNHLNLDGSSSRESIRRSLDTVRDSIMGLDGIGKPRNVILNTSWGRCRDRIVVNFETGVTDHAPCSEPERAFHLQVAFDYLSLIEHTPDLLDTASVPRFLHLYAAGNNANDKAYVTLFGAADLALTPSSGDPWLPYFQSSATRLRRPAETASAPAFDDRTFADYQFEPGAPPREVRRRPHLLAVESRFAMVSAPDPFPPAGNPDARRQLSPYVGCHSPSSSLFGSISAVGRLASLRTTPGVGLKLPVLQDAASNTLNALLDDGGTSLATGQMSGVAAFAWAVAPDMSMSDLKELLVDTASPECDGSPANGHSNAVDLYDAILATDNFARLKNLGQTKDAPVRRWLLDVATTDSAGNVVPYENHPEVIRDGKFTQADIAQFLRIFDRRSARRLPSGAQDLTPDYSRYDLNGNGITSDLATRRDIVRLERFDLDGNFAWAVAAKVVEGRNLAFTEVTTTDLEILVYYAYSPLYEGNEYERTMLLLPYFHLLPNGSTLIASVISGSASTPTLPVTAFRLNRLEQPTLSFNSRCSAERGAPLLSYEVGSRALLETARGIAYFFRSTNQAVGLTPEAPNATPCSTFMAAIPSTGLVWLNSSARRTDSTGLDREYQTRIFFGEPDYAAGPGSPTTPTVRRASSQTLNYGVVSAPTAAFTSLFTGPGFTYGGIDFAICGDTGTTCTGGQPVRPSVVRTAAGALRTN